jgi:hypothetical protein
MLVLTGLAGRLHTDTLSGKGRRFLIQEMKHARSGFTNSIEGLTSKQLKFRKAKGQPSIQELVSSAISAEHTWWNQAKHSLSQPGALHKDLPADASLPLLLNDQALQNLNGDKKFAAFEDALSLYKKEFADQLKYVKTTTENVRVHATQTSVGKLDAYQIMLLGTLTLQYYTRQIEILKESRNFPK